MGTHYRGSREEVRALSAFIVLFRAADTVGGRVKIQIRSYGLTEPQFGILDTLFHLGPLEQHLLARKRLVSGGNVTFIVDKLEAAGYVARGSAKSDRRCNLVRLTSAGRALMKRVFPKQARFITEVMGKLSQSEQEELARLCKKLGLGNKPRLTRE